MTVMMIKNMDKALLCVHDSRARFLSELETLLPPDLLRDYTVPTHTHTHPHPHTHAKVLDFVWRSQISLAEDLDLRSDLAALALTHTHSKMC